MKFKKQIFNFILCFILAILTVAIWSKIKGDEPSAIGMFFYLLILGIPSALPGLVFIYFIYLLATNFLINKVRHSFLSILFLLFFGIIYFFIILKINWSFAQDRYHNFDEFIKDPNTYLCFAVIGITQISLSKLVAILKPKS